MSQVSFLPVLGTGVIVLLVLAGLALVWAPQPGAAASVWARLRRTLIVLLLLVAVLRPGLPGGEGVRASASDLNVFFVVDMTTSSVAEDHGNQTRLEGMREDIKAISGRLAGARFALITFAADAVLRMPLTSDGAALASAADTMLPETSRWSQGSSVTVAGPTIQQALDNANRTHPERARLVFYLGDGEHTARTAAQPLGVDKTLVNGGMVLGYGTTAGGRMKETGLPAGVPAGYVQDPATGRPALSVIDQRMLGDLAGQLGVPYLHRTQGAGVEDIVGKVDLSNLDKLTPSADGALTGSRLEYYWIPLLGVAALVAWEMGVALAGLWALRRPRAVGPAPVPPTPSPAPREKEQVR